MYNQGIAKEGDILDVGTEMGIITKRGNSYAYGEEKLAVGRQNAADYLRDKPELFEEIREKCLQKFRQDMGGATESPAAESEDAKEK